MSKSQFQPVDIDINPLIILLAYSMTNYSPEKANVILSMLKRQDYRDIEVDDIKWSLHFRPTIKNIDKLNETMINIIRWYTTIYCHKTFENGIYNMIYSFMEINSVKLKTMFYVDIRSFEGYRTDEGNSPKSGDDDEERIQRNRINRVLKSQTRKNKNKRRIIIKGFTWRRE